MRSVKFLLVVIAFASSMMTFANTQPTVGEEKLKSIVSQEVGKLLENPEFAIEKNMNVVVKLTVNDNNEIVVLSVDADSNVNEVSTFIKNRLNYKRLSEKMQSTVYTLPIKILSKA
ncbi:hypothetical protein [Tenacibaculum agarivorans]|uniref:hypothetical protein n=1 Tax=Tenacibaculum agarivorans TaxID=1908389 RepID=UPI00094BBCC5|nr:hypothetical protein [Tenacibaculum agarivorans]